MARGFALLVLSIVLWTAISVKADEVESKADDMAKAIEQQNKKVEEQSEAMERAIDDKGKLVDAKEEEDKFETASEKVDAVGDEADKKFEQKANLVDKIGDDTNTAIENQAKKVEALGTRTDVDEEHASNLVEKIGNQVENKIKDPESKVKPKSRMSISYTVRVPHELPTDEMPEKVEYDNEIKSSAEEEKTYPWPLRQEWHGYIPDFHHNPDESASDMSLKPFKVDNAAVEHDALSNEGFTETPSVRSHLQKMFYMPRRPTPLPEGLSLSPPLSEGPALPPRPFLPHHKRFGRRRHHFKEYGPRMGKAGLIAPTSKSSDLGLLVLPSGGPNRLSEDVRNQLEDDELLRKAAKQAFNNDEGSTNQIRAPTKRTGQMIEPSRVVVFPDSAVRGTDIRNMQIKEFHPKNGKGKWLAVHIPDRMSYPRKNVKIIVSKKVANVLQRVVGPNQENLAREIQSILGVDEKTLQKMIVEGQQNDDADMEGDDDDDDDDDDSEEDDDEGNDNDDDEDDEEEFPGDGYFNDGKITGKKNRKKGGSGVEDDNPKVHVEQPEGFELRWEDILNNFKNFNLKGRKKICKLFSLHNNRCHRAKKRKHSFRRKLKHYLLRMLRKFLKSNKNDFESYLSSKLNDALAGRLKPSDDGLLHIYSKNPGNMNMEDYLKDLTDVSQPRLGALSQSSANQDPLTIDEDAVGGGVFKVTPQMNKLADEEGQEPPSDAVAALNNIIHPLLNDQDNKMDEKLQTKILQEELGHVNAEQEEQERQKAKDASVNDHVMYMYQLQNLASHKPGVTPANGEIGGQPISVVNPHQVSLMQMDLPDKNPDIPLLSSSHSKPPVTKTKTRKRVSPARKPLLALKQVFPFGKRLLPFKTPPVRPRLVGTFRIKTPWRPTPRRLWKRSYGSHSKRTVNKVKYLRRMARKRSKRKLF